MNNFAHSKVSCFQDMKMSSKHHPEPSI